MSLSQWICVLSVGTFFYTVANRIVAKSKFSNYDKLVMLLCAISILTHFIIWELQ